MRNITDTRKSYDMTWRMSYGALREAITENVDILSSREDEVEACRKMFEMFWCSCKDPNMLVLARLFTALDWKTCNRLMESFGGMTVKIPTVSEMKEYLAAMAIVMDLDSGEIETVEEGIIKAGDIRKDVVRKYVKRLLAYNEQNRE